MFLYQRLQTDELSVPDQGYSRNTSCALNFICFFDMFASFAGAELLMEANMFCFDKDETFLFKMLN